jgi:hypothetical protein
MLTLRPQRLGPALALLALLWGAPASACNVPVFRYALERWDADPYEVTLFHKGPLDAAARAALDVLERAAQEGAANVLVSAANLEGDLPPPRRALWQLQTQATLPWLVVRYPRKARIEASAWAGPCTAEAAQRILDSPARRDIARKLLRGDTAVWLLLESGDAKADHEVFDRTEADLRHLEKTLVLPTPAPDDPPIATELPLKIAFTTVRVARTDPAERALVDFLLKAHPNLPSTTEPMLFPIFGRGRVISPAIGREIRAEALRDMGEFLTGPCSCEIKEMNPGFDLLLAANWKSLPAYQETPIPTEALVGLSSFASHATAGPAAGSADAAPPSAAAQPPAPASAPAGNPAPAPPVQPLVRNVLLVLGAGVLFVLGATLILRARAGRGSS